MKAILVRIANHAVVRLVSHVVAKNPCPKIQFHVESEIAEHSTLRLKVAVENLGLEAGQIGTLVHVYIDGAYEVEFPTASGKPVLLTADAANLERVGVE